MEVIALQLKAVNREWGGSNDLSWLLPTDKFKKYETRDGKDLRHIVIEPDGTMRGAYHSQININIIDNLIQDLFSLKGFNFLPCRVEIDTRHYSDGYGLLRVFFYCVK